jgi:hypothetical protein
MTPRPPLSLALAWMTPRPPLSLALAWMASSKAERSEA